MNFNFGKLKKPQKTCISNFSGWGFAPPSHPPPKKKTFLRIKESVKLYKKMVFVFYKVQKPQER